MVKCLLITQNVGMIFESSPDVLKAWARQLATWVEAAGADFVALHFQELGGKDWKKGGMERVPAFSRAIASACPGFWCSGCLCNPDVSDPPPSPTTSFTAIGSLFLVRKAAAAEVRLWNFTTGVWEEPCGMWRSAPGLATHARHAAFPRNFFDGVCPHWTRKGYLLTRWQLGGVAVALLNIHLFHDESNVRALQRSSEISDYAGCRQRGLAEALAIAAAEETTPAVQGAGRAGAALFVFGDFNFRLDLKCAAYHPYRPAPPAPHPSSSTSSITSSHCLATDRWCAPSRATRACAWRSSTRRRAARSRSTSRRRRSPSGSGTSCRG